MSLLSLPVPLFPELDAPVSEAGSAFTRAPEGWPEEDDGSDDDEVSESAAFGCAAPVDVVESAGSAAVVDEGGGLSNGIFEGVYSLPTALFPERGSAGSLDEFGTQ